MTTQGTGNGSLRAQTADLAAQSSHVPETADVMAKALFSLPICGAMARRAGRVGVGRDAWSRQSMETAVPKRRT